MPKLYEIDEILEDKAEGHRGYKAKIEDIIDDRVQSIKIIKNYEYLAAKKQVSGHNRGNFISMNKKEVTRLNYGYEERDDWPD